MHPQKEPKRPMRDSLKKPWPIMKTITMSPMPKAVPKLVREISWYFLKYLLNLLSLEREIIAGLSERNVITAPSEATPGRLNSGFISGRRIFSSSDTTPNSAKSRLRAPISTQMDIR